MSASSSHFELFGLPVAFAIDLAALDQLYRSLQAEVHPDRFASGSDAERLQSLQMATCVNEAYQTLKSPVSRARYLLQLRGVDTQEESNTAMPMDFLMQQMAWREALEEAQGSITALESLDRELRAAAKNLLTTLATALDAQPDNMLATETVRKLRFIDKVQSEIDQAMEALEA
jgi:molecular chaperone HscB